MEKFEAFSYLFSDSLMGALILVSNIEIVFDAMMIFGGYNTLWVLLLAMCGSFTGTVVNMLIGRVLRSCKKIEEMEIVNKPLETIANLWHRHGNLLLIFSFIPVIGPIIALICGIVKTNLKQSLLIIAAVKIIFYLLKMSKYIALTQLVTASI